MLNLLQSQLSFFGAIDEAVLFAKEGRGEKPDAVLRIVGTLLPGTTGFGQAGWYRELLAFANRPGVRNPGLRGLVTFPSVEQSIEYLQASDPRSGCGSPPLRLAEPLPSPLPQPKPSSGRPSPNPLRVPPPGPLPNPLLRPKDARRAAGACCRQCIHPISRSGAGAFGLRGDGAGENRRFGRLPPGLAAIPDLPAQIMAPGGQLLGWHPRQFNPDDLTSDLTVRKLLNEAKRVESRAQWHSFVAKKVDQQFADQSLPCFGTLEDFGGQYCSTLYTNTTDDDLKVQNIEEILDPRNWQLYAKFFCAVTAQNPPETACGWARILETIGPECTEWRMQTALLFYYGSDDNGGIFLNYDLDPERQDDSGMVEVETAISGSLR